MRVDSLNFGKPSSVARTVIASALSLLLSVQPVAAAVPTAVAEKGSAGDVRILHALNRFTFGPRPGDVAAVRAMGLDQWFERQLEPGRIDDAAFDERLAAFPAMGLSQSELMQRYPPPEVIKAMIRENMPLPGDPIEHAIYADQIEFYKMKTAAKREDGKAGAKGMTDAQANAMDQAKAETAGADPLSVAPVEHVQALYPEAETERVLGLAPEARFQAILAMNAPDLGRLRRSLSKRELVEVVSGMTPQQKETLQALPGSAKVIGAETLETRLLRDLYSDRQLEAVMTDFWLNHFNVYVKKSQLEPFLIPAYEREVIRPRALGKFEDLLVATAKSPAMLVYLDNWRSTGPNSRSARRGAGRLASGDDAMAKQPPGLNENYGRELMELHTLGVGGGYTQADVTQVAKVFTGWTLDQPYRQGSYFFNENRHEPGAKMVLGTRIPEGGEREGLTVLHLLATSPATARFISTKLAVRFVSDDPPPAMVDRMTQAFLRSGGDIKVVLRTMVHDPEFFSPAVERAKVKTPLEFVVSAVRASDAQVTNPLALVQALDRLGMPLYGMQTPNGYSWKKEPWVSTGALVSRMNFALVLSGDRVNGVRTQWPKLLAEPVGGVERVSASSQAGSQEAVKERRLEAMLLGEPVSERTRATVLAQFDDSAMKANAARDFDLASTPEKPDGKASKGLGGRRQFGASADEDSPRRSGPQDYQAAGMAGLLLGSPEFQRR